MLDHRYIWFSASNEDSSSEIEALSLGPNSRVLCITASGSRPLDLLVADVKSIVALDRNPAQTALAELKVKSLQGMTSYEDWVEFLGLRPIHHRRDIYAALRGSLSQPTTQFWDAHLEQIEDGILYTGKWERYFKWIRHIAGPRRRALADQLFYFNDVQSQYDFWKKQWDGPAWRLFLRFLSSRWLWRYYLREPGVDQIDKSFSVYGYGYSRFDHAARHSLLARSPFAWLLFFGCYNPHGALPLYLQKEHFPLIKERASRINLITDSVENFLENDSSEFDAFSLSDFGSYCDQSAQDRLWRLVLSRISVAGRVCQRKFMNKTESTVANSELVIRDKELEGILFDRDHAYFYSFVIARPADGTGSIKSTGL